MIGRFFKKKKKQVKAKVKPKEKKKMSSKPAPEEKKSKAASHQKILTAEGWKRLMMRKYGKKKK